MSVYAHPSIRPSVHPPTYPSPYLSVPNIIANVRHVFTILVSRFLDMEKTEITF
jgi:hypothetical protein